MINITTPGNEESLRKWFSALLESCLLSRVFGDEDILSNKKGCWQHGLSSVLSVTECLVTSFSPPCSTLKSQLQTKEEVKMSSFFYKKKPALLRATNFSQKES
jgi:hypothetical protein